MNWRQIPGFPAYEISDTGIVQRVIPPAHRSPLDYPRIIMPQRVGKKPHQLQAVQIQDTDRAVRTKIVSNLVAITYIGLRPSPHHCVMHRDGDPDNHAVENLYWDLRAEVGLQGGVGGRLLTADEVMEMRKLLTGRRGELGEIARKFGTTPQNVHLIRSGRRWSHLGSDYKGATSTD